MLNPWFLVLSFIASSCILAVDLKQEDHPSFISGSVTLLVDSLYIETIEALKLCAALSASTPELISVLGDIKLEARF
jgi:hypothetical protein